MHQFILFGVLMQLPVHGAPHRDQSLSLAATFARRPTHDLSRELQLERRELTMNEEYLHRVQ